LRRNGEALYNMTREVRKGRRVRQQFGKTYVNQMTADPSLNLEFVDEALNLVRDADAGAFASAFWDRSPIAAMP